MATPPYVERLFPALGGLWLVFVSALVSAQEWTYTVRPDDTLWELSEQYLGTVNDWRRVQEHNQIGDPLRLVPGTRLRIPISWLKSQPATAKVLHVRGQARRLSAGGAETRQLVAGQALRIGDRVSTAVDSSVTIEFADGSQFLLHAQSELHLDALSAYGKSGMVDTQMRLQRGRAESRVAPSGGAGSRYQITTPSAVAAVRGTVFRLNAERATTRGEVTEGRVGFSGAGVTRNVSAGFGIVAEAGKPPALPQPLPAAPDVSRLPRLVRRDDVPFSWPAVKGSVAYRVQLFVGTTYQALLREEAVTAPRSVLDDLLQPGEYGLRVRGINAAGLEGLNADHIFVFRPLPEPPQPTTSGPLVLAAERPAKLRWEGPDGAISFRVQVATDAEFTALVVEASERSRGLYLPPELKPGRYFWRVAARSSDGEEGPFSASASFLAVLTPPPPQGIEVAVEGEQLVVSWQRVESAKRYQLQFAAEAAFLKPLAARTTDQPRVTVPRPDPGIYYLRARSEGPVPEALGPFGASVRIVIPQATYWPYLVLPVLPFLL